MATWVMHNCQRAHRIPRAWLRRCLTKAFKRLRVTDQGIIAVSFIDELLMRRLHGQFLHDRRPTDVLTFRYANGTRPQRATPSPPHQEAWWGGSPDREALGDILVSPSAAQRYAKQHGVLYRDELARYVVHGLLHWVGCDDKTPRQQRRMRALEDRLLAKGQT